MSFNAGATLVLVLLKILAAGLSLAVPGLVALGVWTRAAPRARVCERVLAAGVTTVWVCLLEVYALGWLPVHRPLDWLVWLHGGVVGVSVVVLLATRRAEGLAFGHWAWVTARAAVRRLDQPAGVVRVCVRLGLLLHVGVMVWAVWSAQWTGDAAEYHLPQALQPWQDGRLGPVQASVVWADSYPRAGALLKFWWMRVTGSDAGFNVSSAGMSLLYLLGVYVAGRRLGLGRRWASLGAAVVPSAPIFALLCGIGYVDMDFGACVVAGAALAIRPAWGSGLGERRGLGALDLACAMVLIVAWWMKFAAVVPMGVILLYRCLDALVGSWGKGAARGIAAAARQAAIGVIVVGAGSIPYVRAWLVYGTPTWPVELRLGPVLICRGPWSLEVVGPGNEVFFLRFAQAWTSWSSPLDADSPGSVGPQFALCCLVPILAMMAGAWRKPERVRGWALLALLMLAVFVMPKLHVARYAPYVLAIGGLALARLVRSVRERSGREAIVVVVMVFMGVNAWLMGRGILGAAVLGGPEDAGEGVMGAHRNRLPAMHAAGVGAGSAKLETLEQAWKRLKPGETMVTAVKGPSFQMYDEDYAIRVEHRPAAAWPFNFDPVANPEHGAAAAQAWLQGLRRDGVGAVIVYRGGAEDRVLAGPGSGYGLVFAQPATAGPVIHVYTRGAGGDGG